MLGCRRGGKPVCQGELTGSDNDNLPACVTGKKPRARPNAAPFVFLAGDVCELDSTAKTGLCDPITLENMRQGLSHGWVCLPADENPCKVLGEAVPRSQCGIDQWAEATGACVDLRAQFPGNPRKAGEECRKRYPVSPTAWAIVRGLAGVTPEPDGIGATLRILGASPVEVRACTSDDRSPSACTARELGKGKK